MSTSSISNQINAYNVSKTIDNTSRNDDEASLSCKICKDTKEKRYAMEHLNRLHSEGNNKFVFGDRLISKAIADTGVIIR